MDKNAMVRWRRPLSTWGSDSRPWRTTAIADHVARRLKGNLGISSQATFLPYTLHRARGQLTDR